jgi:hypothetical protein
LRIKKKTASMNKNTEYKHPLRDHPHTVKGDLLITTVRVEESPGHDYVHVWNRGGKAGTLVVSKGDGRRIATALLEMAFAEEYHGSRE